MALLWIDVRPEFSAPRFTVRADAYLEPAGNDQVPSLEFIQFAMVFRPPITLASVRDAVKAEAIARFVVLGARANQVGTTLMAGLPSVV